MKPTKLHTDYCRNLIVAGKPHVPFCMPDECPICLAYKAGREDAARAVLNKLLPEPTPNEWDAGFNVAIYEAAAAARGGEKE